MSANIVISKPQIPNIPGTKLANRNSQLMISTGIPSLDYFITGGIPIGSLFLLEEDKYGVHSKVIMKYFIAEGVVSGHSIILASQEVDPLKIIEDLPAPCSTNDNSDINSPQSEEQMKIAWRYQNMRMVESSSVGTSSFGHYYDLTKTMKKDDLEKIKITCWNGENIQNGNNIFKNSAYLDLLMNIKKEIYNGQFLMSESVSKRNVLRIIINSIGSRIWMCDEGTDSERDISLFLYMLRSFLRESYAVAFVTIPTHILDVNSGIIDRIQHLSDIVVNLESFSGSDKETNPIFKDYHGLIHVKKLQILNTLVNEDVTITDLAYKLRRKKFLIEILHLPPEFGDSVQREQDECATSTECCSGSSRSKLDF